MPRRAIAALQAHCCPAQAGGADSGGTCLCPYMSLMARQQVHAL